MTAVMTEHFRGTSVVQKQQRGMQLTAYERATRRYGVLAGWALFILRRFLPSQRTLAIEEVSGLDAPFDVRSSVTQAFMQDTFDHIEYWRPEGNSFGHRWRRRLAKLLGGTYKALLAIDPAVVGVINGVGQPSYHLVAHWDPSGASVPTTRQMALHLARERVKTICLLDLPTILIVGMLALGVRYGVARLLGPIYTIGVTNIGVRGTVLLLGIMCVVLLFLTVGFFYRFVSQSRPWLNFINWLDYKRHQLLMSISMDT